MGKRWRIALATYGNHKANGYPLNGCLLVHATIKRALELDRDVELEDWSPALDGHRIDHEAARRMHERVQPGLDAIVAQATVAREVFERARQICPDALRILHRDSTHAGWHDFMLRHEGERWGLDGALGYAKKELARELAEYEDADFITVPSRFVRWSFQQMKNRKAINVGPQVIDTRRWRPAPRRWRKGSQLFLFIGMIGLRKGVPDLLEAWMLAGAPGKLQLAGPYASERERELLEPLIAGCKRVDYIGPVEFKRLHDLYRSVACVIMPSIEEGASMVPHEALACGLGVIATENAGCDILKHDVTGQVVTAGHPHQLAKAIERYAADDVLRYRHGLEGTRAAQDCSQSMYGIRYSQALRRWLR